MASTHTDSHGNFTFVSLTPDIYEIVVDKEGFVLWKVFGVAVLSDSTARVAAHLSYLPEIVSITHVDIGTLVKPGIASDIYAYGSTKFIVAPPVLADYWILRMTPGITFGAGSPVTH